MDKKRKISISINKEFLKKINKIGVNQSKLIEHILYHHLLELGVDTKKIIL